jgi:hypothetical protein
MEFVDGLLGAAIEFWKFESNPLSRGWFLNRCLSEAEGIERRR